MDDNLWDAFSDFQITVMQSYGNGYLMLGTDDACQVTDDGNIAVDFDGEWLSIDGSFFSSTATSRRRPKMARFATPVPFQRFSTTESGSIWW